MLQLLLPRKTNEFNFSLLATILLTLTTCFGMQLFIASLATTELLWVSSFSISGPGPEFVL